MKRLDNRTELSFNFIKILWKTELLQCGSDSGRCPGEEPGEEITSDIEIDSNYKTLLII